MTNKEQVEMASLLMKSIAENVQERETVKKSMDKNHYLPYGGLQMRQTVEAITREITLLRQVLLDIKKNL